MMKVCSATGEILGIVPACKFSAHSYIITKRLQSEVILACHCCGDIKTAKRLFL